MRSTRSSAKKAAKAKLSGFVADVEVKNKKIVFDENEDIDGADSDAEADDAQPNAEDDSAGQPTAAIDSDEEDAVEEIRGSTAREATQKVRDAERESAKETTVKKKRKKKEAKVDPSDNAVEEEAPEEFSDDFFKELDSERADKQQLMRQHKKQKKQKQLGKHTTFVVEDEHNLMNVSKKYGHNIEVIALGSGQTDEDDEDEEERRILLSATLGSTSTASTSFARGNLVGGASRERSCDSRKRGTKDDDTWKRSNVKVYRSGPGSAALFFCKRK